MALIWESIVDYYTYLFDDLSHPLTKGWLLTQSPLPLLTILIAYNIFCTKVGPMLMKNRPPYKLEIPIKLYNIFQVIISLYIFYEGCVYLFSGNFNFKCQGIGEGEVRVARGIQVYLITKLIELLDTIFFVLRKSDRQVTFLHLYHHTLMPIATWITLKYFPGGQGVILGTINSLVHVVMYTYYYIAGLGPKYQKYLWWKKYLTVMQIVQFLIALLHNFISLFYSCSFFTILKVLIIIFSGIFVHMFSKFYYFTYIVKAKSSKQNKTQNSFTNEKQSKGEDNKGNSASDIKHTNLVNDDFISNGASTYTNGMTNGNSNANGKEFRDSEKIKSL